MAEYDTIVNDIVNGFERSLGNALPGSEQWSKRKSQMEALVSLLDEVKELRSLTKPIPNTLGDLSDIPDELKAELSAIKTDDVEDQIFTIINACEGKEANIDTILLQLYRRFNTIHKRTYITNKLWRMVNKSEMLWNGEGGKGYYTTVKPSRIEKALRNLTNAKEDFDDDEEIPF